MARQGVARQPRWRETPLVQVATRHDEAMRAVRVVAAGLAMAVGMGSVVIPLASGAAPSPAVKTVLSGLSAPSAVALDSMGDLFVADTDHCRIVMVTSHAGSLYGRHVDKLRPYVVAGSRCGNKEGLSYPTGVAVNSQGDIFIAEATAARVVMARPNGSHVLVPIAGNGRPGYNGDQRLASQSELNEPTGLGLDSSGDLFIADTANCRVREVPAVSGTSFGQTMTPLEIYTVAGTGVCGSAGRGGPPTLAQLSNPLAVAVGPSGVLAIADNGDQSVLEATPQGVGTISVVAGTGGNGPYLQDGLSATGPTAELNDPEGVAVSSLGTLYITDGLMHAIRVVPAVTGTVLGRAMNAGDMYTLAGAMPVSDPSGAGNGTQWITTRVNRPVGIALSPFGGVFFSDARTGQVRAIG
jgi:hypothetical protein